MSGTRPTWAFLTFALLVIVVGLLASGSASAGGAITITPVTPGPGGQVYSQTPNISATYTDTAGKVDPGFVYMTLDGYNVTGFQGFVATSSKVYFDVPTILKLSAGNHTVTISVADDSGHTATSSWGFVVNTTGAPPTILGGINVRNIVIYTAIGAALVGAGYGGYILYLKRTRNFAFYKYFATHPVNKEYLVLYIPLIIAFIFTLIALAYVYSTPHLPLLSPEYVVVLAIFIALTAYAVDARREKIRIRTYERAFAQFLFEMADAMRGGIDPAKALVELSKTHTNILRKHLRVAADGINIGRPFDAVMRNIAIPMKSPLITRYAELIADASNVGGETAAVVHRAAKDMDDFIKIEAERGTALMMPVAVLYVAFGVLIAVLFSLLSIAPSLGGVNLSFIGGGSPLSGGGGGASVAASVPKLPASVLEERFFDLILINSVGTGVIIGAFTEGNAKYGLLHSLALLAISTIAFAFFAP